MIAWRRALALCAVAAAAVPLAGQTVTPRARIDVPSDTLLAAATRWPLQVTTAGTAVVTVMLAPIAPDAPPLSQESQLVRGVETFWPLRGRAGTALEPGVYRLVVTTRDSASGLEATRVRVLLVERTAPDTQVHPPALDRATFLPETTHTVSRRPGFLLIAGIGLATLATAWSFEDDESISPITVAVPGALAVGGVIGFLKRRSVAHAAPANVVHNRRLVADDLAARQAIAGANARAIAGAAFRIRVVDQP